MRLFRKISNLLHWVFHTPLWPRRTPVQVMPALKGERCWWGVEIHSHVMRLSNVELSTRQASNTLPWFFQRPLKFKGEGLRDVAKFLANCRYVHDELQFGRRDWWIHPAEFEANRAGDCEDHALWAWRVLDEQGFDVRLMLGRTSKDSGHAWVQLYRETTSHIIETTAKSHVDPKAAERYVPEYSFKRTKDGGFVMYSHRPDMIETVRELPAQPLSEPAHWTEIDQLIFAGQKSEAHEAVRQALEGKGSHTRVFLDRYFYLREHEPESFQIDDEAYWADWVG